MGLGVGKVTDIFFGFVILCMDTNKVLNFFKSWIYRKYDTDVGRDFRKNKKFSLYVGI